MMEQPMSIKTNKEIVKKLFTEVFNKHNIALLDELIAPNYTNHNTSIQVRGAEGIKHAISAQFKAYPDFQTTLEDIIAEGEKVVVRCTDHFSRPSDGKQVSISWIEIIRLDNGKIAEAWLETDTKLFSDHFINEIARK
jgi:predicted SnoaL-like aldol condensation-catalyzing enzyme